MKLSFIIPGKPCAKPRPRFNRTTGHAYTPGGAKIRVFENQVAATAQESLKALIIATTVPINPFWQVPLAVNIMAYFEIPASRRCKPTKQSESRHITESTGRFIGCKKLHEGDAHVQRPDAENIAKSVLDGMNGVVYHDDCQVAKLTVEKYWSLQPRTEITVETL